MPVTLESGQRYIAVDVELVFRYECDRGDYLIVFIPYFTDKLFEYVFKSNYTERSAVLVEYDSHMYLVLLHLLHYIAYLHQMRNIVNLLHYITQ